MEDLLLEIKKLSAELTEIKNMLERYETSRDFENWIPRKKFMAFLDYEETQLSALLNSGKLKVAKIGNRKFIKRDSIIKLLENSVI